MRRVAWKQCVASLLLLAVLSLLVPAPAQAAGWGGGGQTALSGSWNWLAAFWERLAAMILGGGNGPRSDHGLVRKSDDGVSAATTTTGSGAILPTDDNGTMINPDG